jgi:hypothetical protein
MNPSSPFGGASLSGSQSRAKEGMVVSSEKGTAGVEYPLKKFGTPKPT